MKIAEKQWLKGLPQSLYLVMCLMLGGASNGGFLENALLQGVAVAILAFLFWSDPMRSNAPDELSSTRPIYLLAALFALWTVIQLIPLPPFIWENLPGRAMIARGDELLGTEGVWRAISMQPGETIWSALGLLPPLAMFALTLRADDHVRRKMIMALFIVALLSSLAGLLQVSQRTGGPAYFYTITNVNTSVGFFSNANHLATLFLIALVFTADYPFRQVRRREELTWLGVRLTLMFFFFVNIFVNRSLAGYALLVPALIFWLARTAWGQRVLFQYRLRFAALVGFSMLVAAVGLWWGQDWLGDLALNSTSVAERLEFYRNTMVLAVDSFPIGTGLGTFRWAYAGTEGLDDVTLTYVNHAHNDYLEFVADMGLVGLLLVLGLFVWLARRIMTLIGDRVEVPDYCYAGAMAVLIVALHSIVDYPARTAAIAALMGLSLGFLARPIAPVAQAKPRR